MKKVLLIILGVLCAISASAVSYGSPYTGKGIYLTSSAHGHSNSHELAKAPTAAIGSVNRGGSMSRGGTIGIARSGVTTVAVNTTIRTAASSVRGGVTTYDAPKPPKGPAKREASTPPPSPGDPGYCEHCHYDWVDDPEDSEGGYWACTVCGTELGEECKCASDPEGPGYCGCPIGDGWSVWLFMTIIAAAYAVWKRCRIISDVTAKKE